MVHTLSEETDLAIRTHWRAQNILAIYAHAVGAGEGQVSWGLPFSEASFF